MISFLAALVAGYLIEHTKIQLKGQALQYKFEHIPVSILVIAAKEKAVVDRLESFEIADIVRTEPELPNRARVVREPERKTICFNVFHKSVTEDPISSPIVCCPGSNVATPGKIIENSYTYNGTREDLEKVWRRITGKFKEFVDKRKEKIIPDDLTQISKIDRQIVQKSLNLIKPLFTKKYKELKQGTGLIEKRANELGKDINLMSKYEIYQALEDAEEYLHGDFVCKTIGFRTVRFHLKAFLDSRSFRTMKDGGFGVADGDAEEAEDKALRQMKLGVFVHKVACYILHQVYMQRKYNGLNIVLEKSKIVRHLGYELYSTEIYRDIEEAIDSLYYLEFVEHSSPGNTRYCRETLGRFITEKVDDGKQYIVNVSERFIGCIVFTGTFDKSNFKRGYFSWAPIINFATRCYSDAGYLLAVKLISDEGNMAVKATNHKVIIFKVETLLAMLHIKCQQFSKSVMQLKRAIVELYKGRIILKTEPCLEKLRHTKAANLKGQSIKFYLKKDVEEIIRDITKCSL